MWRDIKRKDDSVSLYPAEFDVERIRDALRNNKLLSASRMKGDTAYKWRLILEGKQRVLFKPRIRYENSQLIVLGEGVRVAKNERVRPGNTRVINHRPTHGQVRKWHPTKSHA